MRYEGAVYRPPSEAGSLILQVTIGCSHNRCTFCDMYKDKKFRERSLEEIKNDIKDASSFYGDVRRVFLADGNALVMETEKLLSLLNYLYQTFPSLERVGIYAGPQDLLKKEVSELVRLREAGLGILYLGVETGSDSLLREIKKGVNREEMIEAGRKAKQAHIPLSVTVIAGLGGKDKMEEHALATAEVINEIDPEYLGVLTLLIREKTPLYRRVKEGTFKLPSSLEILEEIATMVAHIETSECIFRSNHASNYLPLKGVLARDKAEILNKIRFVLQQGGRAVLRPEIFRAL